MLKKKKENTKKRKRTKCKHALEMLKGNLYVVFDIKRMKEGPKLYKKIVKIHLVLKFHEKLKI